MSAQPLPTAPQVLDTPTHPTTRSASRRYPALVDSEHTKTARDAITAITDLETQAEAKRDERDAAIARMHREDGLRAPEIARLLDMSVSNVRLILTVARKATRG